MRWSLQLIGAVDVISHLELECGTAEELSECFFSEWSLLQNNHSILVINLRRENCVLQYLPSDWDHIIINKSLKKEFLNNTQGYTYFRDNFYFEK